MLKRILLFRSILDNPRARLSLDLIDIGIFIEVATIVVSTVLRYIYKERLGGISGSTYHLCNSGISVIGLAGSLILAFGVLLYIRQIRIGSLAKFWVNISCAALVAYKSLDVVITIWRDQVALLLEPFPFLDVLISNILIFLSAIAILLGVIRVLYDLTNTQAILEERNALLDLEIKQHREAEEHIRAQEKRLKTTLNALASLVCLVDREGHVLAHNAVFTTYFKIEERNLERSVLAEILPPVIVEAGLSHFNRAFEQGESDIFRLVYNNRTHDISLYPVKNDSGEVACVTILARDITDRLQAEEARLQMEKQLQHAQKLEALGTLAGGIAHDMNNVLAVILGRSELAVQTLEEGHPARDSLDVIMRTTLNSSKMIKRLLAFTRQGSGDSSPLRIAALIREQVKFMRSYLPSNVRIEENIAAEHEMILADPGEVQQAFMNIVNNANSAMQPAGGVLDIRLETVSIEGRREVITGALEAGRYIRLGISDTGCGMDDNVRQRLFEPFFTTKQVGEGAGLGMPMTHGSVIRAGGQIDVESAPGKGTRIDVYWPETSLPTFTIEDESGEKVSGDGIRVMIVEDQPEYLDLLKLNLQCNGFQVTAFMDPEEAADCFRENPSAWDIAVVDYMMPGMNGRELATVLHGMNPELPLVLLTGYACGITRENAREYGFCEIFEKPIGIERLCRTLCKRVQRN